METEGKKKLAIDDVGDNAAQAALELLGGEAKAAREAEKARQLEVLALGAAKLVEAGKLIKVSNLLESKKNHRRDFGDLDELGESMLRAGQATALMVVKVNAGEVYEIIGGARRYRAAKKVGLKELRCDVYEASAEQAAELRVIENLKRKDLRPLEQAENLAELEALGYTRPSIAKRFEKSVGWVHAQLLLLKLDKWPRELMFDGKLPEAVAYRLARYPAEQQTKALKGMEQVTNGAERILVDDDAQNSYATDWALEHTRCNARKAIAFLDDYARSLKSPSFDPEDATLNPAKGVCSSCADNSENQPRLEGEEKAKHATCFDGACFKLKTDAAWKLTAAKAEAKGAEVLTVAESKSALNGIDYRSGSRYVKANSTFHHDPKNRTVAQLVAELPADHAPGDPHDPKHYRRPVEIVAADPETKKPVKLFERADVERAFADHFKWGKKLVERDGAKKVDPEAAKREAERHERRGRVGLEVLRKSLVSMKTKTNLGDVRDMTVAFLERWNSAYNLSQAIEKQVEGDGVSSLFGFKTRSELKKWVEKKAKVPELLALLYVLTVGDDFVHGFGGYSETVKAIAARQKIDLKKLEQLDEAARAEKPAAEVKS